MNAYLGMNIPMAASETSTLVGMVVAICSTTMIKVVDTSGCTAPLFLLCEGERFAGWGSRVCRSSFSIKTTSSIVDTISVRPRNGYGPGGGGAAGTIENATHICHVRSIPGREIKIKCCGGAAGKIEHAAHICHIGSIPGRKVADRPGGGGEAGIIEHVAHICHIGSIP